MSYLQEKIESHLAFTTFTASDIINSGCPIVECLESYLHSNYRQGFIIQLCHNQQKGFGY